MTFRKPYITPEQGPAGNRSIDATVPTNVNIFTNPIPFVSTDRPQTVRVPLVPPPQSLPLNVNIFTNPIPFSSTDRPRVTGLRGAPPQSIGINLALIATLAAGTLIPPQAKAAPVAPPQQTYNLALLSSGAIQAAPFVPVDYSVTRLVPDFASAQSSQLNLNLFSNPIPFGQTDWNVTRVIRLPQPDTPSYNLALLNAVVQSAPFVQTDWLTTRLVPDYLPPLAAPNLVLGAFSIPFVQTDWSVTRLVPDYLPSLSQGLNPNLFTNQIPFAQYDWFKPVPSPGALSFAQQSWLEFYSAAVSVPFAQYDWSKSWTLKAATVDSSQGSNPNLYPANAVPFAQFDWSVPQRSKLSISYQNDMPNLIINYVAPVVTTGKRRPTLFIANIGRLMN